MFPGFDGGHLLEQVLAGDEGHRGQERDHADSDGVVAGVRVPVDDAVLLAVFFPPALGRYAREHDYREELEGGKDELILKYSLIFYSVVLYDFAFPNFVVFL